MPYVNVIVLLLQAEAPKPVQRQCWLWRAMEQAVRFVLVPPRQS